MPSGIYKRKPFSEECKRNMGIPKKGKKLSEETKRKISVGQIGNKNSLGHSHSVSEETKRKLSLRMKDNKLCLGRKYSQGTIEKIKLGNKGKIISEKTRLRMSKAHKGEVGRHWELSEETKKRMSKAKIGKYRGSESWNWKGGKTPLGKLIRKSSEYEAWRGKIYQRDRWICRMCGQKGGRLHAHHLRRFNKLMREAMKEFPLFSEYDACLLYQPLWNTDNGITLCKKCHKKLHRKKRK